MNKIKLFFLITACAFSFAGKAQMYGGPMTAGKARPKITQTSGDVKSLKNVKQVNIIYDYSNMLVGDVPEQAYLDKKTQEMDKKESGKGDKFKQKWATARKTYYEPKFQELFNKTSSKLGIVGTNYVTAGEVTLKVSTTMTEPGFNAGIVKKPAAINLECFFTDKNGNEILHYTITNAPGAAASGFDYDTGTRLGESYAKAAKMLMKDIKKKLKKLK